MDMLGVTRTIDHAVYVMLNTLAIWLWRVDSALLGVSMLSYGTQDWLTGAAGSDGGVWRLLQEITTGLLNQSTWKLFFVAALMLFGLSLVARPFFSFRPVEIGRLFFFAALSYAFISQGVSVLRELELSRVEAGSYIYEAMAGSGTVTVPVPGSGGNSDEILRAPNDLDGAPLRGWEAVSTSYFLATSAQELHRGVPPHDLLLTYCLYDPNTPIDDQDEENNEGCSPRTAWDEWDEISFTLGITEVWGIPLPDELSIDYPLYQEHPENRQLGIRQAQSGVARLALGPLVALFPVIEANVGLMLALAASFVYLTLPVALLFSFFLYTESMVTRLVLQWISIFIRTLILNGLVAIFLLLLMGAASSGSLTAYLGLVGVGVVGGFFLVQMAAATMKESLSQSLGAIGTIWKGSTTAALGEGAARPAEVALGAAKLAATGAALAATAGSPGGAWSAVGLADPAQVAAGFGLDDLKGSARKYGEKPDAISRLANKIPTGGWEEIPALQLPGWTAEGQGQAAAEKEKTRSPRTWAEQFYAAREKGYGRPQIEAEERDRLGEKLSRLAQEALERRSQAETMAALQAAEAVTQGQSRDQLFDAQGRLKKEAVQATREQMGEAARAFQGKQGSEDLAVLIAATARPQKQVAVAEFRQAAASVAAGVGEQAPGRVVPQAVGLDPAAAGAHFSAMNRFTRLSEQAGLTVEQRQQLLQETHSDKGISADLRGQLETSLRWQQAQGQAAGLRVEEVIAGAEAMPPTLQGPMAVKLPGEGVSQVAPTARPAAPMAAPPPPGRVTPAAATAQVKPGGRAGSGATFDDPLAPPGREKQAREG